MCQKTIDFELRKPEHVFKYHLDDSRDHQAFNNIINRNEIIMDNFILKTEVKYYQNHEFHKLAGELSENNVFSLLHPNICALLDDLDKLKNLANNSGHNFSIIAVFQTWTPKNDTKSFKPETPEKYQKSYGVKDTSTKSGCGFYTGEGNSFKPKKDLEVVCNDQDDEFQNCQI